MFTANQLICHAIGDYVLQSDWMALNKTKRWAPALAHVLTYCLPFCFLSPSWRALAVIVGTHYLIDRYRLARYVVWAKNFLAPQFSDEPITDDGTFVKTSRWWHPWSECAGTGYHKDRPAFMAVWLMIIADNVMHVIINALALKYL